MEALKNQSLFEYLDELSASPRPNGLDPIVRYFPLKNNGQNLSRSEHVHEQMQSLHSSDSSSTLKKSIVMSSNENLGNYIFSGPLTIEELRRLQLLRSRKANEEVEQAAAKVLSKVLTEESPKKEIDEDKNQKDCCNEMEEKVLEAPPPSPKGIRELHVETEEVLIQEFSLEEAHFSGCNLSGLNLSFESGISDPLAVEPTISKHFIVEEEVATEVDPKEPANVPAGLYTLACISDLAEKLTIEENQTIAQHSGNEALNDTTELLKTPVMCKTTAPQLYSPISPADLSSQYMDAIDESVLLKTQDTSKVPSEDVIEAIVSLQHQMQDKLDSEAKTAAETSKILDHAKCLILEENSAAISDVPSAHQEKELSADIESKDDSILHNDSLCDEEIKDISLSLISSEDSPRKDSSHISSLMNDTIDEMDMILSMGVSYLETRGNNSSHAEVQTYKSEEKLNQADLHSPAPFTQQPPSSKKYFCTPQMKTCRPLMETQGSAQNFDYNTYCKTPSSVPKNTAVENGPVSQKKYFQSPAMFKTPVHAKTSSEGKSSSVGSSAKSDTASKVHVSTPFRVPKSAEPRSADFKQPSSRLPKQTRPVNISHITSPVSQYIRGPVVAPRIAVVHSKSPLINTHRQAGKTHDSKMPLPKSRQEIKAEIENSNPNLPAVNLPYVNYDSGSSIKVVEHKESKLKPLPNKIKKLMPSPGSVMRHTGRVNIPEHVDGRQEVSMLVSHDAFH